MSNPVSKRKELQRDRATVRAEVRILKSSQSSPAEKAAASEAITKTVLKSTGLAADGGSGPMLATLTAELVDTGAVPLHGIEEAIKLNVTAEDAASIPKKLVTRLGKLV